MTTHHLFRALPAGALSFLMLFTGACTSAGDPPSSSGHDDIFSTRDTLQVEYAEGFRLQYREEYKLLEILNPYQDRTDTLRYALIPRGRSPEIPSGLQEIEVPVRSIIATSTTHVALTNALQSNEVLSAMVGAEYVYNAQVRRRVREGEIVSLPQGEFNKEMALSLDPDLVMVSAGQSSQMNDYRVLLDSGIPVLINADWLETTPLGKAEWIKAMGALLNRSSMADSIFSRVESRYNALLEKVENIEQRPLVINNLPYKGAWFVSAGNSFTARYLRDAKAEYPWFQKEGTGGLRLNFESVYEVGLRADVWLNPGAAQSIEEILGQDPRFKSFQPVKRGRVYNNNRRLRPSGGNDYWETGVVRPDLVLADLIRILHPSVLPGHELYFYRKLPRQSQP